MSNPIKNDGRERVPKVANVKVVRESGQDGDPVYTITLTLKEPINPFYYNVKLQFSNNTYPIPATLNPNVSGLEVLYSISTDFSFPQSDETINVELIYSGGEPIPSIQVKTDECVNYEYE